MPSGGLRELHVRNLAVLAEASVELGGGLNVLTGETGAGKSIVVDSLALLAGARADQDLIRTGAETLSVAGVFAPAGEGWRRVLAEAFRVLKPGGRFAVSDIVFRGEVPAALRRNVELWIGCVAGALEEADYRRLLAEVGFEEIEVEPTRIYRAEDARAFLQDTGIDATGVEEVDGKVMSAFVRARKPRA